jgi:ribonuclease J
VAGVDHGGRTERELEDELASICKQTNGLVAVFGSAQNLDRLVTAYRAARRSGRILVTDLYGATVAAATRTTIPQPGFDEYRIYVPQRQRVLVKQSGQFHRVNDIRAIRVFGDTLAKERSRLLTYLPASTARELVACGGLDPAGIAMWSMWNGYLGGPSGVRFADRLRSTGIPLRSLHSSGHATVTDIRRLITALAPTQVVPIHTDSPAAFGTVCQSAVLHEDGSWWAA